MLPNRTILSFILGKLEDDFFAESISFSLALAAELLDTYCISMQD